MGLKLIFDVLGQSTKREERLAAERQQAEQAAHATALESLKVLQALTASTDRLREAVEAL